MNHLLLIIFATFVLGLNCLREYSSEDEWMEDTKARLQKLYDMAVEQHRKLEEKQRVESEKGLKDSLFECMRDIENMANGDGLRVRSLEDQLMQFCWGAINLPSIEVDYDDCGIAGTNVSLCCFPKEA